MTQFTTLSQLADALRRCRQCDLYRHATQAIAGEGKRSAAIVFIGEQPGDAEDLAGRPFVGPAGKLLDRALEEAQIDRSTTFVTNAVKHFKFESRGKRRIHQKPNTTEITACHPWLELELTIIRPRILVCLGATAAQSVFGPAHRVTKERGRFIAHPWASLATSTVHPSAILRARDDQRAAEYRHFVDDLKAIREVSLQPASR